MSEIESWVWHSFRSTVPHRSEIQMSPFSGITAYPSDVMSTKSHCFPIPKYELITTEHFPNGTKCWQICIGNVYLRIVKKPQYYAFLLNMKE